MIVLGFFIAFFSNEALGLTKRDISSGLKNHFLSLMAEAGELHHNLKMNNVESTRMKIQNLIQNLKEMRPFQENKISYHRKVYLSRQLRLLEDHLRFLLQENLTEEKKTASLKKIMSELIQIEKTYIQDGENKNYSVYYCSPIKSAWIQKKTVSVFNPFDPRFRKCGKKIK